MTIALIMPPKRLILVKTVELLLFWFIISTSYLVDLAPVMLMVVPEI